MTQRRRLAAIMFTDIQGYTQLMQQSEEAAVQARSRHRAVFEPTTKSYGGEIIQYYGDGTLSIFNSCVDAVRCAYDMQLLFQQEPAIPVRIGIHVGDIILDKDDIIGDCVNLASRIESLAVPGSVMVSEKVVEEIKNKDEIEVQHMGRFHFKNDEVPRVVYALSMKGLVVPQKQELKGKLEKSTSKSKKIKYFLISALAIFIMSIYALSQWTGIFNTQVDSLAVLPFADRIIPPGQDHIVEGIQEELISRLIMAGLNVEPYQNMKQYRETSKAVKTIARELKVDALVEGFLTSMENKLRIKVQLIQAKNEAYIMDPYESETDFSNIYFIYSELIRTIASQIKKTLSPEVEKQLDNVRKVNSKAYELYLKGRYHSNRGTVEDVEKAIDFYNQALQLDPEFGQAHSGLVESYLLQGFGAISSREAYDQFRIHVQKAQELDEVFVQDHHQMAMIKIFSDWDWEGAERELSKAIEKSPDSWDPYDTYCQFMWAMGRMDESIAAGEKAIEIDPEAHFAHCDLSWAYYLADRKEQAKKQLNKTRAKFPFNCPYHEALNYIFEIEDSVESDGSLNQIIYRLEKQIDEGSLTDVYGVLGRCYALTGDVDKALKVIALPDTREIVKANIYLALDEPDKALYELEKAYGKRSFALIYIIKMSPFLNPLRDNPRFINLLDQMGLSD